MRQLILPTVFSRQASPEALAAAGLASLPHPLSQHQLDTFLALTRGSAPIVFNRAMTGDGKTLAGLLTMLRPAQEDHRVMALYPTNELVRDQLRAVEKMQAEWELPLHPREINSRTLDERLERSPVGSRGDALMGMLSNADLALTNPDIFHYIMQMYYTRKGPRGEAPDRVLGRTIPGFGQLTFDEFHIFGTPQVVSVINALLFLREIGSVQRTLFLSATPGSTMLRYLERAELDHVTIEGEYHHGADPGSDWRPILRGAELHVTAGRADEWVMANVESVLLPFFREQGSAAKGAIIVNSIATAERLTGQLRAFFKAQNISLRVEKNTGLSGPMERRRSYEADLLVGTSTVDVGVDFRINFLIFESRDGGSFLQRLGRLVRHDDFTRADGTPARFERFVAHALVPEFVFDRLFVGKQGEPPLLGDVGGVDRERLSEAIRQAFPSPTDFHLYGSRWGILQSASIIVDLNNRLVRDSYQGTREQLAARYQTAFGSDINRQFKRLVALRKHAREIADEAQSFRGGSPWTAAVIDERTHEAQDRLLLYDLRTLLANYHVSLITEAQFTDEARRLGIALRHFERAKPIAHLRLHGIRDARTPLTVTIDEELTGWGADRFDEVGVLKGLGLEVEGFDELNALNRRIARRPFVALVTTLKPDELRRKLYLPWPFPTEYLMGNDRVTYSIAFGREALLLETAMRGKGMKSESGGAMIY